MQISLSIELRAMLALAAKSHNMSQLSLIRCAISHYLQWLDSPNRQSGVSGMGQEPVPLPPVEAMSQSRGHGEPVPEPAPEPEPAPKLELMLEPESEMPPERVAPEQTPKRAKKAKAQ